MSDKSKISNLSASEKAIKDKQGPHEKGAAKSDDSADNKKEKSDAQSKGGKQ